MNLDNIINLDKKNFMNTFGDRQKVCFTHGKGINLWGTDNKKYYDFLAGIAVSSLGHSHKSLVEAITNQAQKLIHCSSLYYIENQAVLADKLTSTTCADKIFFSNSGAEANEGAIKLARLYFKKRSLKDKYEIITLINSFHGRTLTTIAATGQEKMQSIIHPLPQGFKHIEINNIDLLKKSITSKTCAIMLELIQGESGINLVSSEYLHEIKKICNENDILLIFDEIQTGIGRTGKLMCYEHYNIEPDIFTLAKGLGGGVPIGAVCAKDKIAKSFEPGEHGSTFGGNPLACSAALAVLNTIESENLISNAEKTGEYLYNKLTELKEKFSCIIEVRGKGLLIGIEFNESLAISVKDNLLDNGFLVGSIGNKIIRIAPPLIVTKNDCDLFVDTISKIL